MKLIEMKGMEIVFAGEPWTHNILPCAKQAIVLLLQPRFSVLQVIKPLAIG